MPDRTSEGNRPEINRETADSVAMTALDFIFGWLSALIGISTAIAAFSVAVIYFPMCWQGLLRRRFGRRGRSPGNALQIPNVRRDTAG